MEKALISIINTRKDKVTVKITFHDNKSVSLSFPLKGINPEEFNNKEVEIERPKGPVTKIVWNGKTIYDTAHFSTPVNTSNKQVGKPYHKESGNNFSNIHIMENNEEKPSAPYNFIPLNEKVVPSDFDISKTPLNKYHEGRFTGYIETDIEAKTPIYIRDTMSQEEELRKDSTGIDNPDFFSPAARYRIPGSTMRGMIKTILQILSYSKFLDFQKERKFHFRSFADRSLDLREKYADRLLVNDEKNGYSQSVKAGYLIKQGRNFYIKPADHSINNCYFFRVEEDLVIKNKILNETMSRKDVEGKLRKNNKYHPGFKKVRFTYEELKTHQHSEKKLFYAKVIDIKNYNDALKGSIEGTLVYSGWIPGKKGKKGKHMHWVIGPADNNTKLEFIHGVIEDYKNDINKSEDGNLMTYFQSSNIKEVPCFYIDAKDADGSVKVKSFGYTGIFRVAYEKSLYEFIPETHKQSILDFSDAVFGNSTFFSGRVFFEDAFLNEGSIDKINEEVSIPKILGTPKPTTFQNYLLQNEKVINPEFDKYGYLRGYSGIMDYNDDTVLRGYKLYWHKNSDSWKEVMISINKNEFYSFLRNRNVNLSDFSNSCNEKAGKIVIDLSRLSEKQMNIIKDAIDYKLNGQKIEKQHTKIKPINAGAKFSGRIRFENLSGAELGALLLSLKLKEKLAHKIGMGKPLGLGSIKITPSLYLSNRQERYKSFSAEAKMEAIAESKMDELINEFQIYILTRIDKGSDASKYWQEDRMKELEKILDFANKPNENNIQYMDLEKFKDRRVLQIPSEIK